MRKLRHPIALFVVAVLVVIGIGVGVNASSWNGWNGPLPRIAVQSPVDTAVSRFRALNEHDMPYIVAAFWPSDRETAETSGVGSSLPFEDVHCHLETQSATTSAVRCTFQVANSVNTPMQNVTYFSVDMQRKPSGPWLITDYGQP